MPVVEVPCPKCGVKLKASEEHVGKKAKCKKCGEAFRIPGAAAAASAGDPPALSTADGGRIEVVPPPKAKPAAPVTDVAELPSADAFDFTSPSPPPPAPAKAPRAAKPAPPAAAEELPAELPPEADAPKAKKAKPAPASKPKPKPEPAGSPFEFAFGDAEPEEEGDIPRRKKRPAPVVDLESNPDDEPPPKKKGRDEPADKPRKKKAAAAGDEPPAADDGKPRYLRPAEKGSGMGKAILLTVLALAGALALGAVAVVVVIKQRKPAEPTKKEEKPAEEQFSEVPFAPPPAPVVPPPVVPPKDDTGKADLKPKEPDPKPKAVEPKPKEKAPGPKGRSAFALPAGAKALAFDKMAAAPAVTDRPSGMTADLDTPIASIKAVYPPHGRDDDLVAFVSLDGADAHAFDVYSGVSGRRADRVEVTGRPNFTDVTADRRQGLAVFGTQATVWDLTTKEKLLDAADVYAGKPDHQKAGLAAAAFLGDADARVTAATGKLLLVSAAGAVSVYDTKAKAITGEYAVPGVPPGSLTPGRSLAVYGGGVGVVVAVGSALHDVAAAPKVEAKRTIDLGGTPARALALAAARDGRILFAFDLDAAGDRGVLYLPHGATDTKGTRWFRWPRTADEPTGAFFGHPEAAGVSTAGGDGPAVVLFDTSREGKWLAPLGIARAAQGLIATGGDEWLWYAVPDPAKPGASLFRGLSLPINGFAALAAAGRAGRAVPTFRLDASGLAK